MWAGVFPAVTTKFTADGELDHAEMERCFALQIEAGCDGIIVCGSLGEGPMLSHDEKIEVLKTAQKVAGKKPVLLTVNEAGTREARSDRQARRQGRRQRADGGALARSTTPTREETVAALSAVAAAGDLPVMIYSNRLAYRVDVTDRRHGEAGQGRALSSPSRNRPTTSAARPRSSTVSATATTSSPASTTSPSRRCRSARSAGWRAW